MRATTALNFIITPVVPAMDRSLDPPLQMHTVSCTAIEVILQPNESGLRWQEMMRERWNTTATFYPSSNEEAFGVSGFHGDYSLKV